MSATRQVIGLLLWVAVVIAAAAVGSAFTAPAIPAWYAGLRKPSFTPPSWIFGPVWSALYLMMAAAAWLVWRRGGWAAATAPLVLFLVQLAFNVGWSGLFFGLRQPGAAFAEIVVLWCLIAATLAALWRVSPAAGALLAPYLAWVSFAAALNFAVWRLNA
jgi:tryptophan-rich sensory protein